MSGPAGFENILAPITIKGVRLRNRIAMAPLHTGLMQGPQVSEQLIAYYAERARNGLHIRCEVNSRLGAERYLPENYRVNAPHPKSLYYPGARSGAS